ncbi:MAG: alpha-amylase [Dysgonamonadaceae bacterium]|jgi:glycosidase|nr:alpha-amylase [Dysgonamonadaceae bacterium]
MTNTHKIIIYQVFTRLFGNDNSTNKPHGSIAENGTGKFSAFSMKALNAIRRMGVTHVWYTGVIAHASKTDYSAYGIPKNHPGVVKGNAGSPYAIRDYYDVDPDLAGDVPGRMNEFAALITRTHRAGMKAIIDFVPNHVAREYHSVARPEGTVDLGSHDNPHTTFASDNNFYYMPGQSLEPQFDTGANGVPYHEHPAKVTGNDCFSALPGVNDWYETVKLNYGVDYLNNRTPFFDPVPDTWHKMLDILLFWASQKIDGFRCDMAEMVPAAFWNWVIPQVKAQYPEIIFIAEVYNPAEYRNYLFHGCFDYLYDKVGLYDTLRAIVANHRSAEAVSDCWKSLEGIQHRMLNFLENHDEQRIASAFFAGDARKALPAMIVSATLNINPVMLYFGQELGEKGMDAEGFSGTDGRTTIFDYWSLESIRKWRNGDKYNTALLTAEQKELRAFYTRLLTLCNEEKAISQGIFYDLMYANGHNPAFNPSRQYAYIRQSEEDFLLIAVNFDDHAVELSVNIPPHAWQYTGINPERFYKATDLLTGQETAYFHKETMSLSLSVAACSGRIVKMFFL